jgi:hypothetical protein
MLISCANVFSCVGVFLTPVWEISPGSWPLIPTGVLYLVLGIYVLRKNPMLPTSKAFFSTMTVSFASGLFGFLTLNSPDMVTAIYFGRWAVFFHILIYGGYLFLSTQMPFENRSSLLWKYRLAYVATIVVAGIAIAVTLQGVEETDFGYHAIDLGTQVPMTLFVFGLTLFAAFNLARTYRSVSMGEARWQCLLMVTAIVFLFSYTLLMDALQTQKVFESLLLTFGHLTTGVLFGFAIFKHRMFVVLPQTESSLMSEELPEMPKQEKSLLIEERKPFVAYEWFLSFLGRGCQGLLITRTHPARIREEYGLVRTPIIWLANSPAANRVEPSNLSVLEKMVVDFIQRTESPVVLIDGIEFLLSNNSIKRVLTFLYVLNDEVAPIQAPILVSLDPQVLSTQELALFEREFEVKRTD